MEEIRENSPSRHVISFGRYIARRGKRSEEIGSSAPRSESVTFQNIRKIATDGKIPRKITFTSENIRVSRVTLVGRIISGVKKIDCGVQPMLSAFTIPVISKARRFLTA